MKKPAIELLSIADPAEREASSELWSEHAQL
jgi:hypothetical protein